MRCGALRGIILTYNAPMRAMRAPQPFDRESSSRRSLLSYVILGVGVLVVSTAAILIRVAQAEGAPSLSIAALRLAIASLLLTPLVIARRTNELRALGKRDWMLALLSGVFLAAHFSSWIASLAFTSVASSVALVTTNPVWIALASWLFFRERLSMILLLGIGCAIAGSTLIFLSDSAYADASSDSLIGNSLALIGSFTVCGYLLIGRKLRQHLSLLTYIWLVYSSCAVVLVVAALLSGVSLTDFTPVAALAILALALGPQLLGHTAFNWALSHLSPAFIAVAILGEPIGSAVLAWFIFGEQFAALQLYGFIALLLGIYLAGRAEQARLAAAET